jgi:hypothetical protein
MTERALEKACMHTISQALVGARLWKIRDTTTAGQPDFEVAWNGHTTKIECKVLRRQQTVHDVWEDPRQLVTCAAYARATGRCWVVAWRMPHRDRATPETLIYDPRRLTNGAHPHPLGSDHPLDVIGMIARTGVARVDGYDHMSVVRLIRQTHV